MAVDKLVDSTQLDSDLTSVANAIRTKGGTSAQLAFPADFVSAIAAISGSIPQVLHHMTITPTSDYTQNNKLSVNLTAATNYIILFYAVSELTPPASGTIFLGGTTGKLKPARKIGYANVLRAANTVGSDGSAFGGYDESTGILSFPNTQYSNLIAGETYELWQFGIT